MATFCRWVGGVLLCGGTVAAAGRDYTGATAAAALAFVWLIAGQLAELTASRRPPRDP